MRAFRLSKEKQVIMHLGRYIFMNDDEFRMPFGLTQDGIGNALSISRAHVSITTKSLETKGMVYDVLAHTDGAKVRRKVYRLTPKGIMELMTIKKAVYESKKRRPM